MNAFTLVRSLRVVCSGLLLALIGACSSLLPKPAPPPAFYALDGAGMLARSPERDTSSASARDTAPATAPRPAPALIVNPPHAAAGFDSARIIYTRQPHQLEHFARSEWIDTPARMLAPLIVAAIERGGAFAAVVQTPSAAVGDIRLDTEMLRLQQDFAGSGSRVRFTLRATLVDHATRRVLASREFDESAASATDDPYGGVVAANRAVQSALQALAAFCGDAAARWQPPAARR